MKKFLSSALMLGICASMFALAPTSVMVLNMSSNGYTDEQIRLVEDASFSAAYDYGSDAAKYYDVTGNAVMYVLSGLSECPQASRFASDNLDGTKLGFVANGSVTAHRITFTTIMGSAAYNLIDLYNGTVTPIVMGQHYDFNAPVGAQIDNRFEIRALPTVPGMSLVAHEDPENAGDFYCTFFHSGRDFKLPAGAEAYVATVSAEALNLVKVADGGQVIPKNVAYILKADAASIELANADATPVAISASNDLLGKDFESAVPANCYVFSGHSTDNTIVGVGFYPYEGAKLGANKAYVILNTGSSPAPRRLPFVFAGTTAIDNTNAELKSIKTIENGMLIIEKNGVRYNAMGQIVK